MTQTDCMTYYCSLLLAEIASVKNIHRVSKTSKPKYRLTCIIVNNFESENLYVVNFINRQT